MSVSDSGHCHWPESPFFSQMESASSFVVYPGNMSLFTSSTSSVVATTAVAVVAPAVPAVVVVVSMGNVSVVVVTFPFTAALLHSSKVSSPSSLQSGTSLQVQLLSMHVPSLH